MTACCQLIFQPRRQHFSVTLVLCIIVLVLEVNRHLPFNSKITQAISGVSNPVNYKKYIDIPGLQ